MIRASVLFLTYASTDVATFVNARFTIDENTIDIHSSDDGPFSESLLNLETVEFDLA